MYTYVLVSDGCEQSLGCVLQHIERKSLEKLWSEFSQENEDLRWTAGYRSVEFDVWLVEKYGFARLEPIVFDVDHHQEYDL